MERGRTWSSGTAAAALTGVVLTGGATLGAAVAEAAPVVPHAPVPTTCTVGPKAYVVLPVRPAAPAPARRAAARDTAGRCVDAISKDVLVPADVAGHALVRVPVAKPRPKPAPATTTTVPKPPTTLPTTPATTTPATTTPATTTPPVVASPGTEGATPGAGGGAATTPVTTPAPAPTTTTGSATPTASRSSVVGRSTAPAAVPAGGRPTALPGPTALPRAAAPAAAPGPAAGNPPAAVAPLGAVAPGDGATVPAVVPASYLDPLGAPEIGALPGEPAILQTLGGDTSGVTTSSRVEALGLDALHRGGGVPAVVGVTIMAGLGGLALRHRVLQRIRRDAPDGGVDPDGGDLG